MAQSNPVMMKRMLICALPLMMCGFGLGQQKTQADLTKDFVIDRNRPYVYIEFGRIAEGVQREPSEPKLRIFLRLVNNCRIPVLVSANGVPDGSPDGEVGMMHEVVPDPPLAGVVMESGEIPLEVPQLLTLSPNKAPPKPASKEQSSAPEPATEEMPSGYMFHVGSLIKIEPGKSILFSVPINHLGRRWHMEVPFEFAVPKGKGPRHRSVGGEPQMVVLYSLWDLPDDQQKKYWPKTTNN